MAFEPIQTPLLMKYCSIFILIPFLIGCATHIHERPIAGNQGELLGYEKTKWRYRFMDSKAASVSVETSDLNYHRKVSAAEAELFSDEEAVKQLAEGISKAVTQAVMESINPTP